MNLQSGKDSDHLSILMIEDNPADVRLVREALSGYAFSLSFKLQVAPTLAEGLTMLKRQNPDIVLLDLNLPDSFGYETFNELRQHYDQGAIVVLSSGSDEDLALRTVNEGAQDYLFKDSLDNHSMVVRTLRYAHGRYRSRLEILAAENHLRSILQAVSDGIVMVDRDSLILFANPAAESLLLGQKELVGKRFPFPVNTEGELEVGVPRAGHGPLTLSLKAKQMEWDGQPAFCISLRDVTTRKEMAEDLIRAREEAFRASQAKSEFLARMSHEIRTPLNAIIGMATLLHETALTDEQKRYVKIFERAGGTLSAILNDLLDLSKIEVGEMKLEEVPFQLDEVVENVCELLSLRAHERGIELNFHLRPEVPTSLVGDPHRLHQVLLNLLSNAIKFTEEGGVYLSVENEEGAPNGHLLFSVADTGIGIPHAQWDSIFDSFKQGDASVSRKFGGSGLGLSICRRLVELMRGEIWLSSTPELGTTFYFTTRCELQPEQRPCESAAAGLDVRGRRALIIDSNSINRMIVRETLEQVGVHVEESCTGEDSLERLARLGAQDRPFDLILLDARVPGMDAFELTRKLEETCAAAGPARPALVMMINSYHMQDKLQLLERAGLHAYLVQPVKRRELLQVLRQCFPPSSIEPAPEDRLRNRVQKKDPNQRKAPILVVEDSEDNREIIQAFLRRSHLQLEFAHNGLEAVKAYRNGKYDLILMDMQMPEMDGFAATREIRQLERMRHLPRTPIVALTAYALKQDQENSYQAGCDFHLSKPISKAKLLDVIERYYC